MLYRLFSRETAYLPWQMIPKSARKIKPFAKFPIGFVATSFNNESPIQAVRLWWNETSAFSVSSDLRMASAKQNVLMFFRSFLVAASVTSTIHIFEKTKSKRPWYLLSWFWMIQLLENVVHFFVGKMFPENFTSCVSSAETTWKVAKFLFVCSKLVNVHIYFRALPSSPGHWMNQV